MEITTLCTIVASLSVFPSRIQFFRYESVTLICGEHGNSSEWRVVRNTSRHINEECAATRGKCFIDTVYQSDSGVYWCESGAGECSNAVNVTVTGGHVVLESPVHPVQEGEPVTLRCTNEMTSSSNLTTKFYKDDILVGSSSTGNMTIHSVSTSDEGVYKCKISGAGESPDSWLAVREAGRPESFHYPLAHILLPVVGVCLSFASVMLLCLWRSCKVRNAAGETDSDVSYVDVVVTQEVQPKTHRETDPTPTIYSTLQPWTT
ncbi:hypothetical protein D5F01_LYC22981 [Larimichthys crocea]|uniref:Ig-like domain-containing protein n=1 Tax=Larimichthys crocea TaxID=215358 RepID=A0A6G0HJL7_LARCR|nr:hypothetical protein D5F01_LYC22981 [Larimichthys crocea]